MRVSPARIVSDLYAADFRLKLSPRHPELRAEVKRLLADLVSLSGWEGRERHFFVPSMPYLVVRVTRTLFGPRYKIVAIDDARWADLPERKAA
jgi:hypothetical protein